MPNTETTPLLEPVSDSQPSGATGSSSTSTYGAPSQQHAVQPQEQQHGHHAQSSTDVVLPMTEQATGAMSNRASNEGQIDDNSNHANRDGDNRSNGDSNNDSDRNSDSSSDSDSDDDDEEPSPTWREILHYVGPYLVPVGWLSHVLTVVSLVLVLMSNVLDLVPALILKRVVDTISENATESADVARAPVAALIAYGGVMVGQQVLRTAESFCISYVMEGIERRFAVGTFDHLHNLSLSYHTSRKTGEVTGAMDRGVSSLRSVVHVVAFTVIPLALQTVLISAVFWKIGIPLIALTTVGAVALFYAFTFGVTGLRNRLRRNVTNVYDKISNKAIETLTNYETVSMFGRTKDEISSYRRMQEKSKRTVLVSDAAEGGMDVVLDSIHTGGSVVGLIFAALATVNGNPRLTPGDFILIQWYIWQLYYPFISLGYVWRNLTKSITDLEKVVKIMRKDPDVVDREGAQTWEDLHVMPRTPGHVEFRNVSFSHKLRDGTRKPAVCNVSFTVEPGKVVALVGESGCGKSTIIKLLLRMYDVDDGSILIDGHDVRDYQQHSLRKNIGVVSQETVLFNESLKYNIKYGKEDATEDEVRAAARVAALDSVVEDLPDGLKTVVGERGVRLSGGQRQRVGAARCLIRYPCIVALDEATASLDVKSEREIQTNMEAMYKGRSTIVVAHRLSTIMRADEIIVLGEGSVVERGTHAELLAKNGKYAEMWAISSGTDMEPDLP